MIRKFGPTKDEAKRLAVYAGADYNKPKRIQVTSVDIESDDNINDLIDKLLKFRGNSTNATEIENEERSLDVGGYALIGFNAYRMETPDEVADRVAGYLRDMLAMEAKQVDRSREDYLRLKKIHEPDA